MFRRFEQFRYLKGILKPKTVQNMMANRARRERTSQGGIAPKICSSEAKSGEVPGI